jgi:lipooligosaccharide transport system permease protein
MSMIAGFDISWRALRVWQRDAQVYMRTWKVNFIPPLFEPLLYLLAFGAGLGMLVGTISYRAQSISYIVYLAPGLLAITAMFNAFFENAYGSYVRMYYQKTFDSIISTPLSVEDVIVGELLWGATKSLLAVTIMGAVISCFGFLKYPSALLIYPFSFLIGILFGGCAMCCTALVRAIDTFNVPFFVFVTPMYLFSGTFFPLESMPVWVRNLAQAFPLTHVVVVVRGAALGRLELTMLLNVAFLVVFAFAICTLSLALMKRRLIK